MLVVVLFPNKENIFDIHVAGGLNYNICTMHMLMKYKVTSNKRKKLRFDFLGSPDKLVRSLSGWHPIVAMQPEICHNANFVVTGGTDEDAHKTSNDDKVASWQLFVIKVYRC